MPDTVEIARRLRETLPAVRAAVEGMEGDRLRRVGGEGLSITEIVAGLYRMESRLVRPAITVMIDDDMPRLPGFDLAQKARKEGYGAYDVTRTLRQWGEFRTGSVVLVESLDADALERPGSIGGRLMTIGQLLDWWVAEETAWLGKIRG